MNLLISSGESEFIKRNNYANAEEMVNFSISEGEHKYMPWPCDVKRKFLAILLSQ
jgi:hypothetical protein